MIRAYKPQDMAQLLELYRRQGFEYEFPALDDPAFVAKLVLEDKGRIEQAIALRVTSEAFFLADPEAGAPRERWEKFQGLHAAMERAAAQLGYVDDVHAFLPPAIARPFGRRLASLGWVRDTDWPCYSKIIEG